MIWLSLLIACAALAGVIYLLFVEGEIQRFDRRIDQRGLQRASRSHGERLSDLDRRLDELEDLLGAALGIRRQQ